MVPTIGFLTGLSATATGPRTKKSRLLGVELARWQRAAALSTRLRYLGTPYRGRRISIASRTPKVRMSPLSANGGAIASAKEKINLGPLSPTVPSRNRRFPPTRPFARS